jgi:hypothetical protein
MCDVIICVCFTGLYGDTMIDNLFKIFAIVVIYILTPFMICGFYNAYPYFDDSGIFQTIIGVLSYYVCLHHVGGLK